MKNSLTRFRIMAIACGINLAVGCLILLPLKYFTNMHHNDSFMRVYFVVWTFHGYLYMVYLLTALQLGVQKKMRLRNIVLVLLGGTVPFASFVAERKIVRRYS